MFAPICHLCIMHRWGGLQLVCVLPVIDTATPRGTVSVSCPTFQLRAMQFRVRHRHPSSVKNIHLRHTQQSRAPTHVRVCALRLHAARMCYGASSVRPLRITVRGEGIATLWAETMAQEDKKMRRKKREKGNIKHTV
ncbi:hypothetical protein C8R44DRAFT_826175, partial [Mycena epipterygia]